MEVVTSAALYIQVGSIYEYANKNPVFGVLPADSGLYAPILGFFVLTGFPTAVSARSFRIRAVERFNCEPLCCIQRRHFLESSGNAEGLTDW